LCGIKSRWRNRNRLLHHAVGTGKQKCFCRATIMDIPSSGGSTPRMKHKPRILLVDSEPGRLRDIPNHLTAVACEPIEVTNGYDGFPSYLREPSSWRERPLTCSG
jgi:hypothetical protein